MNISDCFYLGNITKPFGYKGEVDIFLDVDDPDHYKDLQQVFVEIRGSLIPFFLESIRLRNNHAVVRFHDVKPEDVVALIGAKLYLPLSQLPALSGKRFYFHEIVDYHVVEAQHGNLGKVSGVLENGPQPIFQIQHPSGKEILIPILDPFIEKVDRDQKTLYLIAPEGLVEFYLD